MRLDWYWPLIGIAAGVALQMLVSRSSVGAFRLVLVPLELVAIGGAIAAWFA